MAYSTNVLRRAEAILGYGIQTGTGERTYSVIDGVVYTDLFEGTPVIDGYTGTISKRFNSSQATPYWNELRLDPDSCDREVKVTASWGSTAFTTEVTELLDWLTNNPFTDTIEESSVQSKRIEDFSVTYKDSTQASNSYYDALRGAWSFYIRNPVIISVTPEQNDASRYF